MVRTIYQQLSPAEVHGQLDRVVEQLREPFAQVAEQHDEWAEARRYLTIPNAVGNEALPTPNMLDAAA